MPAPEDVPVPPQPGEPGWLLGGRYRVIDRIGAGGMAEVFRAHDQLLARDVAVKVFRAHTDPDEVTGGVQRQELELQTLARLSHPNLITLFDGSIGSAGEPAFLVMELINGPSLAARIAQGPLSEPETREIATQIAGALAYVHSQHMVHRDIKPANILLGADSTTGDTTIRARLSDFGIVRLLGSEHLTSADFMIGTASYLAPEQARGAEVGPPADVYALGLVLIEALTGRRSYDGPALEAVLARLDRSPEIPAGLPQPWPELLHAMTATDPQLRPSAAEVARTLRDSAAAQAPMLAVPGSQPLAGEAVLAGGAPLAAASGLAGTAALAAGFTGGAAVAGAAGGAASAGDAAVGGTPGFTPAAGFTAAPGFTDAPGFTAAPGFTPAPGAASPDQPTSFISAGLPPMPPPVDDEPDEPDEPHRRAAGASRGPLLGAAAAASVLVAALTAGGLLLVRDPAAQTPTSTLPGQSASSSSRPSSGATPSNTPTSLAPIGGGTSVGTGGTTARTSSAAPSSTPASSSAAPTTSAPPSSSSAAPTTSAPPSSSSSPSSSPSTSAPGSSASGTPTSPGSTGTSTGTGAGTTSAAPADASNPPPSATKTKQKRPG